MGRNLRQPKMKIILNNLMEAERQGHEVNKEKLIAFYCFKLNAARRTVIDYIKAIEASEQVKIKWVELPIAKEFIEKAVRRMPKPKDV